MKRAHASLMMIAQESSGVTPPMDAVLNLRFAQPISTASATAVVLSKCVDQLAQTKETAMAWRAEMAIVSTPR